MYKSTESEHLQLSFFQFNASCGMQLDCNNEWIRDANRLPWKVWESQYSAMFSTTTGNVAKPSRMVIGSLIIQQRMGFTDRELVKQIQENPYYQYFIGNESFQHTPPFAATLLVEWRKRIWARLILYNFCEAITTKTFIRQSNRERKHYYQLNFTRAIHICRFFLSIRKGAPPDVESLISRELLPVRPGRSDPRKVKFQSAVSFLYRVA